MKPDALIDLAAAPPCKSLIHRVPEAAQPVLQRARERYLSGERFNVTQLARIINREFNTELNGMGLNNFLKGVGCRCD